MTFTHRPCRYPFPPRARMRAAAHLPTCMHPRLGPVAKRACDHDQREFVALQAPLPVQRAVPRPRRRDCMFASLPCSVAWCTLGGRWQRCQHMRGVPAVKTDARARGQSASRGCVERASVSQDLACHWEPPRLDSGERAQGAGVRQLAGRRFLRSRETVVRTPVCDSAPCCMGALSWMGRPPAPCREGLHMGVQRGEGPCMHQPWSILRHTCGVPPGTPRAVLASPKARAAHPTTADSA